MPNLSKLPDPLIIDIINKLNPSSFSRTLRTTSAIYHVAICNRIRIKIHLNVDYDITPPSRRRQMVFFSQLVDDEKKQKILFPKDFSTFRMKTIPDLAFFQFERIIFTQTATEWDEDMTREMLREMKRHGVSCIRLVNPIKLRETVDSIKHQELSVMKKHSIIKTLESSYFDSVRFIECIPEDDEDIARSIERLPFRENHVTIWAHNVQEENFKRRISPVIEEKIERFVKEETSSQLDLFFSKMSMNIFLDMFKKLDNSIVLDFYGSQIVLFPQVLGRRLVSFIFEDYIEQQYILLHFKAVSSLEECLAFYHSVLLTDHNSTVKLLNLLGKYFLFIK